MTPWSKNNRACTTLWTSLSKMKQLITNFDDSEGLKMSNLTFFNSLASADLRKQQATIVADQLDTIFRTGRGAKYENDISRGKAMISMIGILTDEEKTVSDLATAVDEAYNFWGELE